MNEVTHMTIGAKIKKLRRERDMTQEDLAEALGISAASVSQWECDKTAPDISQLPVLSNIFEVTTDFLLGVDVTNKEKEIETIIERALVHRHNGYPELALPILREGIQYHPTSHKMMLNLAQTLHRCFKSSDHTAENERNEIIKLCQKILNESTDDRIRISAKQVLCYTYEAMGDFEKIRELAETQASLFTCYEDFMVRAHTGTKKLRYIQRYLITELSDMIHNLKKHNTLLDDGSKALTPSEELTVCQKILSLIDLIIEDGNYGFFRDRVVSVSLSAAELCLKINNPEAALEYIVNAADHAVIHDTEYDKQKTYTCLLLRGTPFGGVSHNSSKNLCAQILDELNESVFDFVRESPRFTAVIEQLKPHAAER